MDALQAVEKHRAIGLVQYIALDFNDMVRPDPDDVCVKRCVVQFAQCQAIAHYRLAARLSVRDDVCGV